MKHELNFIYIDLKLSFCGRACVCVCDLKYITYEKKKVNILN